MTAASGADRECAHNEDRASCAVGCGDRAGGGDELYQYTVTNGSHARAFRFPASGADQPTLRDQLAKALYGLMGHTRPWAELEGWRQEKWACDADALLPLIEADRERAKAEASWRGGETGLIASATVLDGMDVPPELLLGVRFAARVLRETGKQYGDRLAALRGSTGGAG